MTDIPIIFSAAMIQALLAGRKTMTRRLRWTGRKAADGQGFRESPWARVKPGDRLWVREGLALGATSTAWKYRADDTLMAMTWPDHRIAQMVGWAHHQERRSIPSIHMPRWASRLTLVVTATKIEPIQEISERDATAEGAETLYGEPFDPKHTLTNRRRFELLWRDLHNDDGWARNPEVVALSFPVHKQNIDSMKEAA